MEQLLVGISLLIVLAFFWALGWFMGRQHEHAVGTPSASHNTRSHAICDICGDTGFVDEVKVVNGAGTIVPCPKGCRKQQAGA